MVLKMCDILIKKSLIYYLSNLRCQSQFQNVCPTGHMFLTGPLFFNQSRPVSRLIVMFLHEEG